MEGHKRSQEVTGGHGRSRKVTEGHGRSRDVKEGLGSSREVINWTFTQDELTRLQNELGELGWYG